MELNAQKMAPGAQRWQQDHERRLRDVSAILDLTPQQQTKAKQIFNQAWAENQRLMPELRQDREQMKSQFKNANTANFDQQADRLATREGQIYADMIRTHTKAMKEFYSILTPEQQMKADGLYDLLTSQAPFQFRMRQGGPAMRHEPTD